MKFYNKQRVKFIKWVSGSEEDLHFYKEFLNSETHTIILTHANSDGEHIADIFDDSGDWVVDIVFSEGEIAPYYDNSKFLNNFK